MNRNRYRGLSEEKKKREYSKLKIGTGICQKKANKKLNQMEKNADKICLKKTNKKEKNTRKNI